MKLTSNLSTMCSFIALLIGNIAFAHDHSPTKNACIKEAETVRKAAIDDAQDTFNNSRLVCLAGSQQKAACIQACLQTRKECVAPINATTKACYDAADEAFETARAACKTSVGCSGDCPGNTAFQQCMVPVRTTVFNAIKTCRTNDDRAGRKACRTASQACRNAC